MPRKRHNTSEEESDNEKQQRNKKSKKSSKAYKNQDRQKEKQNNKKSRSVSSPDLSPLKKRDHAQRRRESESDNNSPVKRGVQSRIERPGNPPRFGKQDSRDRRSNEASPERRRRRVPDQSPEDSRFDRDPRQSGNVQASFRSASPEPQRGRFERPRRDSFDANEYRVTRPVDFDRRDRDEFMHDRFFDDRDRNIQYERRDFRDNFRDDFRDRPLRLEDRDRFDPRRDPLSPERGFPRRNDRFSPDRAWTRNEHVPYQIGRQRSEQDERFQRRMSLSPVRRNDNLLQNFEDRQRNSLVNDRRGEPLSPVRGRRQMERRSMSLEDRMQVIRKSRSVEMEKSPVRKNKQKNNFDKNKSPDPKGKSEKTGKKKKKAKNDVEGKISNKNKENKKERSESLERSFERSKQSLVIPGQEIETKLTDSKKSSETEKGNTKSGKKNASKRPRSTSGSPPRNKKSKDDAKNEVQGTDKKSKKKDKKDKALKAKNRNSRSRSKSVDSLTLTSKKKNVNKEKKDDGKPSKEKKSSKRSHSRSPSPQERSLNRSRSSDVSLGRKHDMAQFESEPESGEITDSEEEVKNALKSQVTVNKPLDEGEEDLKKDTSVKRSRTNDDTKAGDTKVEEEPPTKKPKPAGVDMLTGRTGGAYIPPARLRAMQASITDKSSVEYQRISWEALKKSINGLVNKVNVSNIENIVRELFQENIVRGRGLFARSIIQAQSASPTFTHVYAALVSIVNTKFPQNGELVLKRLVTQFKRGYKRNDKTICLSATRFVAHLVNQQVAHEVLALEILTLLLEEPTDDSVEVAIGFLKECGQKLTDVSPRGINAIFERLRNILHESQIDKRVQYMIEVMFAVRKDQFKDYPALVEDLDLVEEEDQFTHLMTLEDAGNGEELLNVFRPDPSFQENEEKYKILKKEILGEGSSDEEGSDGSGDDDDEDSSEEEEEQEDEEKKQTVIDQTETNMVALRRTIYLTIQSSLDFEECAHKLMKMELKPGQEIELCNMILDCCAQMRTYEKFFGLLAGRFCLINKKYVEPFENMFKEQYDTIHRLETNKLRNVAKFFSHLLFTDSISWAVLSCIKLNEEDTTSASRIFIKILFQELSEYLGLPKLNERLKDPTLAEYFVGLMPRDNPRDTRFAINFFTTIGLGGLTDDLREHLKDVSKKLMQQKQEEQQKAAEKGDSSDSSDSDSDSSSGSDSDSESNSSSDSESSEDEKSKKRKKNDKDKQKGKEKDSRKDKGKEKNVAQKTKQKDKVKDKPREKDRGRDREKNNQVKDRKEKKAKKKQMSEAELQKERDKQFKKFARFANYDEEIIDPKLIRGGSSDRERRLRKGQENGERRERRRDIDDFDRDIARERVRDNDLYMDRPPIERSYDSAYDREDRFDGGDKRRRGKRSKDFIEIDRNDPAIRVERNFERMDIYEDKFERDRARNIEYLRARPEFEDYYEGRSEDRRGRGSDRDSRRRDIEVDDPSFDARLYRDKIASDSRRRNRSEERMPLSRDSGRRRR